MLVLSRKKNESIVINDEITITVIEVRGDKVRLGIQAPREVPVHRDDAKTGPKGPETPVAEDDTTVVEPEASTSPTSDAGVDAN